MKIKGLAYNTISGDVYVYLTGDKKRRILRQDEQGFFVLKNGLPERFTDIKDIKKINEFLN